MDFFIAYFQVKMNELDALRQEAETLKNAIRVSIIANYNHFTVIMLLICIKISLSGCTKSSMRHQPGAGNE
jgi:hypothetical protein